MSKANDYIFYKGEKLSMADWIPMSVKADQLGNSEGYVRKLVFNQKRGLGRKPIDFREIPELKLTLVKK